MQHGLPQEGALLQHDEVVIRDVLQGDRLARSKVTVLGHAADDLTACHRQELQIGRGLGNDDDAEVELITLQLFADGDRTLLVEVDVEMRVAPLKAGEDLGKQICAHHRRDADFDRPLQQLLVVVDLENGILYVAQRHFDALQKDRTFGGQRELLLAAVKELDAELTLEFFDRDGDVRLGDAQAFGGTRDVFQTARHLEVFELSQFHEIILQ